MKVLLVNPKSYKKHDVPLPLSILYLYSALQKAGFETVVLNNFTKKDLLKILKKESFLFAGITTCTSRSLVSFLRILRLAQN
jgi:hypothetical protein